MRTPSDTFFLGILLPCHSNFVSSHCMQKPRNSIDSIRHWCLWNNYTNKQVHLCSPASPIVRTSMIRKTESQRPCASETTDTCWSQQSCMVEKCGEVVSKFGGDDLSLARTLAPFLRSARALTLLPQKKNPGFLFASTGSLTCYVAHAQLFRSS